VLVEKNVLTSGLLQQADGPTAFLGGFPQVGQVGLFLSAGTGKLH
jgi:hypothetical protein